MAKEERQRERKRRRRRSQADGEPDVVGGAADEQASGHSTGEAEFEWESDEPLPAPADVPTAPMQDISPPVTTGPAAVAQILAPPPPMSRETDSADGGDARGSDPFFAQRSPPPHEEVEEPAMQHADERFEEPVESSPPIYDHSHQPRWTHEPVLMALLLVALIVLALDTYFTWRLNGLSDRLAAATKPAPTAMAGGERPWVGVDSLRTAQFANGGQPVTTVHIVNSGREPAYDLRSNTVGSLRASSTPAPQVPTAKGPLATTGLLLPNTGGNLTFFANTRALTAEEAASVRSGKFVLWLAGRLDYKDSKGNVHLTTFRYRYNPQLNSFIAAPDGNSAS